MVYFLFKNNILQLDIFQKMQNTMETKQHAKKSQCLPQTSNLGF